MKSLRLFCAAAAALLCLAGAANAQTTPELAFTVETVTGPGTVTPTLKWSTTPTGAICTATGNWSGEKAASGQEMLENVTGSRIWTLGCEWSDSGATLSWALPTENTDGSPFTNLGGLIIWYGRTEGALTEVKALTAAQAQQGSYRFEDLAEGAWFFMIAATSDTGVQGLPSTIVSKTVGGRVTRSVTHTINPPKAPVVSVK